MSCVTPLIFILFAFIQPAAESLYQRAVPAILKRDRHTILACTIGGRSREFN
jgi:hypothetical protein